jgi:hypothetical protein
VQPYNDHALRDLLTPPDSCPMPCFMGIRPGMTTAEEAATILQGHEWVSEATVLYNRSRQIYLIQWSWNGTQPRVVDTSKLAHLYARDSIVYSITTPTLVPFGDIWLTLGTPDRGIPSSHASSVVVQNVGYLSTSVSVQSIIVCPVKAWDMLQTPVELSFIGDMNARFGEAAYPSSTWINAHSCV